MINCNKSSNNYLAPPAGFPFRLYVGNDTAQAFIPPGTETIVAVVQPDYIADVHMALYTAPTSSGGDDGALVDDTQVDSIVVRSASPATLTITVPDMTQCYVVRLWYDNAIGGQFDTLARDASVTDTTKQAKLSYGVSVTSFYIT